MNEGLSKNKRSPESGEKSKLIKEAQTILLITDVQDKLIRAVQKKESTISNISYLSKACKVLNVKIICTEQTPEKLGSTIDIGMENKDLFKITKDSFSCCQSRSFIHFLKEHQTENVVICGLESHICIQQTALDLLNRGYQVYLVADAITSRNEYDHRISLNRMIQSGAIISTVESVIFELCKNSHREEFKEISTLIKERMSKINNKADDLNVEK